MTTQGKVLLVTGGSRGIGRAVVLKAVATGFRVAFSYLSDDAAAEAVVKECEALGGEALALRSDVADRAAVGALFEAVDRRFGRLDAVVNNAGITGPNSSFMAAAPEAVEAVLKVNVNGTMDCCREAIMRMALSRGGNGGSIVNLSSGAARTGSPNAYVWYGAAKAAIETFTLGLAQEVARDGIRVNCVSPGVTATEIHSRGGRRQTLDELGAAIPIGRVAEPGEIADPILYLLSDAASYVVGAVLRVGGGR